MKKLISKQKVLRSLLLGLGIYIWFILVPGQMGEVSSLFCYTRDEAGNKTLVRDFGTVYVEDVFIMEIPVEDLVLDGDSTITVIMEDETGNQKKKTIKLCPK